MTDEMSSRCIIGPYMAAGARRLLPIIERYRAELGSCVLELGPNKHPLITPETYDGRIVYVELSEQCLEYLAATFGDAVAIVRFDVNQAWRDGHNSLREAIGASLPSGEAHFHAMILSQILNYVDFRIVLRACRELAVPGALVFVNNIMNHGVATMFHPDRPHSVAELVEAAAELGFTAVEMIREPAQVADPTKVRDLVVLRAR